jgi:hypothetical protein
MNETAALSYGYATRRAAAGRRRRYVDADAPSPPMSRTPAYIAAVALTALACGLGTAACGGGTSGDEQAAQARWQSGVPKWRADMLAALNEISLMLSSAGTRDDLHKGTKAATAQLDRWEQRLEGCQAEIEGFGDAPGALDTVRREALRACRALTRGAGLVRDGVTAWQAGIRSDRDINRANVALGNGQRGIDRVRRRLNEALAG